MNERKSEKALLSLEASIVVSIFIFLMLYLYSFFIVFEARNELAHVLLSSCNSLALDRYEISVTIAKGGGTNAVGNGFFTLIYGVSGTLDSDFVSHMRWYESKNYFNPGKASGDFDGTIYASEAARNEADLKIQKKYDEAGLKNIESKDIYGNYNSAYSTDLEATIKKRFLAYLSGGDTNKAEKLLKRLHVADGINGLDVSYSYITSGKLYVVLRYSLEYEFNPFGLGNLNIEQTACSKLW